MAKVNLRVATLKHGNMKNCDLRGAVLAGADLEVMKIFKYYQKHNFRGLDCIFPFFFCIVFEFDLKYNSFSIATCQAVTCVKPT